MEPNITDKFTFVALQTKTQLANAFDPDEDDLLTVDDLTNWTSATEESAVFFAIDVVDEDGKRVPGSYSEWKGIGAEGNVLGSLDFVGGDKQTYLPGENTRVYMPVTMSLINSIVTGILTHSNQDGTLKNSSVNTAALASNAVTTEKVANASITDEKWRNGIAFKALKNSSQTLSGAVFTKTTLQVVSWDIGEDFSNSTSEFTAPVKGIYHFNGVVATPNDTNRGIASIYCNGVEVLRGFNGNIASVLNRSTVSGDLKLEANDKVELYAWRGSAGQIVVDGEPSGTQLSGHLVTRIA